MRAKRASHLVIVLAVLSFAVVGLVGRISPRSADAATGVQARMADQFVDSIGVATHLSYGGTPNAASPGIKTRLAELGVRHLRDGWGAGSQSVDTFAADLATSLGIKFTMVWDPRNGSDLAARVSALKSRQLSFTETIEGANEWDSARFSANGWSITDSNWVSQLQNWSSQLANAIKGDPATAGIPLAAPSLARTMSSTPYNQVGQLPGLSYGTTHDYPGNTYMMTDNIANTAQSNARIIAGAGKPVIATETGFTTSVGATDGGYAPTPESVASVQGVRLYFEHFRTGITRSFSYNLVNKGTTNTFENGFGLLKADLTPKPEFIAIKNMIALLKDPGAPFTPGSLAYSLSGGDANTRTTLLQKRDGTFYLAVWQQTPTWNGSSTLNPADVDVTVTLPQQATVNTFVPTRSASAVASTTASTLQLKSSEELQILELKNAGGSTSATSTTVAPTSSTTVAPTTSTTAAPTTSTTAPASDTTTTSGDGIYLSDLTPTYAKNGWGSYERDRSNGEGAAGDGRTITLNGQTWAKGLGTHAASEMRYSLSGSCSTFSAVVGVDDEVGTKGSVTFEVWNGTATRLYASPVRTGSDGGLAISVPIGGVTNLRLVVTNGGDNINYDHSNWAGAKVSCGSTTTASSPTTTSTTSTTVAPTTSSPRKKRR
jgi:hypothetical protein